MSDEIAYASLILDTAAGLNPNKLIFNVTPRVEQVSTNVAVGLANNSSGAKGGSRGELRGTIGSKLHATEYDLALPVDDCLWP